MDETPYGVDFSFCFSFSDPTGLQATGKELLAVSRLGVIAWGIIASGLCCMCTGAYISYNFMGCVLSVSAAGAVFPIFFSLLWNGCTAIGACVGTVAGVLLGCCLLLPSGHMSALRRKEKKEVYAVRRFNQAMA